MKFLIYFFKRNLFFTLILILPICVFSQNKKDSLNGIEALSYFKSKAQSLIITYGANISDSSKVFKKYNLQINFIYNDVKAEYDQYRGFMKDCILRNSSVKKLKECLKSKNLALKAQLDSLQVLVKEAYLEQYIISQPKDHKPIDTTINVSLFTADFTSSLVGVLIDGAIKIWTQINNLKKQQRDAYLSQISSKDYDLSEFSDLLLLVHKPK